MDELLRAYNARDMEALLALFHPSAEWHTTPEFLWPGPYRGRIALRELFTHWFEGWEEGEAVAEETAEAGDVVMLCARMSGRSAGSGEPVELRLHWVLHVRSGLIDVVRSFHDCDEARAAL